MQTAIQTLLKCKPGGDTLQYTTRFSQPQNGVVKESDSITINDKARKTHRDDVVVIMIRLCQTDRLSLALYYQYGV